MKNDCVFCAIGAGEIPSLKIFEDDVAIAFLDINPMSRGHALVVPRRHCEGLLDADAELLSAMIGRVRKVAGIMKERLGFDGFNILQNNGEAAGQTVMHIHFHIVPRYGKEEIEFTSHKGDMDELKALTERVRMQG